MSALPRYVEPVFERTACASCKALAPECIVPVGDGAVPMCWLCAHAVTEHDAEVGAPVVECGCNSEQIYPADYRAKFARPQAPISGELTYQEAGQRVVRVHSHFYGSDGKVDRSGPILVQSYRVDELGLTPIGVDVREPDRSMQISRGMRAARRARED